MIVGATGICTGGVAAPLLGSLGTLWLTVTGACDGCASILSSCLCNFWIATFGVSGLGLVVLVPCRGLFMWPFDVAGASWRYRLMVVFVSPGHVLS